jgi:hypothetical protein
VFVGVLVKVGVEVIVGVGETVGVLVGLAVAVAVAVAVCASTSPIKNAEAMSSKLTRSAILRSEARASEVFLLFAEF